MSNSAVQTASSGDDKVEHKRAMFGDAFGSRGDYSKGFFYAGKRTYIGESNNLLEPPERFMSSMQVRNHRSKLNDSLTFKLEFHPAGGGDDNFLKPKGNLGKHREGAGKKKVKSTMILDKYSTLNPTAWSEEFQAGVKYYVNHSTGEVSTDVPWEFTNEERTDEAHEVIGTGAQVYDSSELDEYLAMLDAEASKSSKLANQQSSKAAKK